ncbi:MAG TPA: hypothetical protein EYP59_11210 [Thiotrichaceae bacterium]|nr:hypothetical protein [Thiotrichaceae bacterium]
MEISTSDFRKSIDNSVTEAEWEMMAKEAGLEPALLKDNILTGLEGISQEAYPMIRETEDSHKQALRLLDVPELKDSNCKSQPFEISIYKIIGASVEVNLCGTNLTNWSADVKVCLIIAGSCVLSRSFRLDPHNAETCLTLELGVGWLRICVALRQRGNKLCVRAHGKGCLWVLGWHCANFDVEPVCFAF